MSKKKSKKKGKSKTFEIVTFATAIINAITALILLIKSLLN